jgi:hypothetical protein
MTEFPEVRSRTSTTITQKEMIDSQIRTAPSIKRKGKINQTNAGHYGCLISPNRVIEPAMKINNTLKCFPNNIFYLREIVAA